MTFRGTLQSHFPFHERLFMTYHGASYPIRHPDRPEEPALSLSKGVEGSRLDLKNKHRSSATRFLRSAPDLIRGSGRNDGKGGRYADGES